MAVNEKLEEIVTNADGKSVPSAVWEYIGNCLCSWLVIMQVMKAYLSPSSTALHF